MKIGISLGGGAARGVAHIGVIQELENAKIPIHVITGTSIGALVGGMYAVNPNAEQVKEKFLGFLHSKDFEDISLMFIEKTKSDEQTGLLQWIAKTVRKSFFYGISLTRLSYLSEDVLKKEIGLLVPDIDITQTKIPFSCAATDLKNNTAYYFDKGPLTKAIIASCSIPGIFPPVQHDGTYLIDGSWAVQNPVARAREMGADFVIAVSIETENGENIETKNGLDVVMMGNRVTRKALAQTQLADADVVITPDVCHIHWSDFSRADDCLAKGCMDAVSIIPEIKRKMRRARFKRLLGIR